VPRGPEQLLEFRTLVNAVKDYAIFMVDPDGHVATWNEGAHALKGYEPDEIIGGHLSRFYTPEEAAAGRPAQLLAIAARDGRVEDVGWRVRKDGTRFWADVVLTAVRGTDGELRGFLKVTRDLTEARQAAEVLRQSEERSRLLLESVTDYAIFMLDTDGTVATWNLGAERIKGYPAAEVIGKHFSIFYLPADILEGKPARELEIARTVGRYEDEGWRVRKNGAPFWASLVITAVHDATGTLRGYAKVTRDLTERRKTEQQLRAAELQAAREREQTTHAQQALRQRDEFISIAAHELRTPLTTLQLKLQGMVKVVERELGTDTPATAKIATRLGDAVRQADRFGDLVERLLDISRVVGGTMEIQPESLDLGALAREVVDAMREQAEQARSQVRIAIDGEVDGRWDRRRLEQVLTNLIANAIKYGAGQPVEVTVEAVPSCVRVVVTDRGIGISEDDLERIFGRFERAVPLRHYGGMGLGLYITRHIVEAHGGTIRAESELGKGSRFTVELPRQAAATAGVIAPRDEASAVRQR
jgi:PAS domain S-box-containing protein